MAFYPTNIVSSGGSACVFPNGLLFLGTVEGGTNQVNTAFVSQITAGSQNAKRTSSNNYATASATYGDYTVQLSGNVSSHTLKVTSSSSTVIDVYDTTGRLVGQIGNGNYVTVSGDADSRTLVLYA